jgi:hypothetical protein
MKTTDRRRYGVIEVRLICSSPETYHLSIGGRMWSEVEWSRLRQAWCIQDAAGHCLTHIEHIVGQDRDPQAAIRLAKKMIVDGRMPSPEEALAQLKVEQECKRERKELGEPFVMDDPPERVVVEPLERKPRE